MPLKFAMSSLDGVDPVIAALYTAGDGGNFILTGVEGVVSRDKVTEFRDNNIALTEKLKTFEGIDPAKYASMGTELSEAKILIEKNAGKLDEDAVNKIVEDRVKTINADAATLVAERDNTIAVQSSQLETLIIDTNVSKHAVGNKVLDTAVTDVMLRAKSVFKVESGKPIAYDGEGNKMYAADGTSELGIGDWVKGLVKSSPHLFEASVEGGLNDQKGKGFTGDPSKMSALSKIQSGLS